MDIEREFNELVGRAKVGATSLWSSDEKAICWAQDEIARLRAKLAAMESQAKQLLFTDPETGEELRPKFEPQNDGVGGFRLYVTNKDGTRNWMHTIRTEEI